MAKKSLKSAKRFGPRYGKTVKAKVAILESSSRGTHKCPYCTYVRVRRVASGIWNCGKCGAKFTARSYSPDKRKMTAKASKEGLVDENMLLPEEEEKKDEV